MKITLLTPALAAILGLALASAPLPTHAQTDTSASATSKKTKTQFHGTLSAVDASANTITVDNKADGSLTFTIASTAKITKDKTSATLADFAVGDKVHGSYTKDASGTLTATTLSDVASKSKSKSSAPPAQ